MRWHRVLCLALLPGTVAAQEIDYGSIDGFYVPQAALRWNSPPAVDDDGSGFGLRVLSRATDTLMVLAEVDQLDFDGAGGSTAQYRVGAGLALPSTTGAFLTYDHLDLDRETAIAFGLHGRLAARVAAPLTLYGSAGYVMTRGDSFYQDGFELTAGAAYDLPEPWGLFVDYRATLLDDRDSVAKLHRDELRVGVRFRFDC
jgi:opacity protein-like surface antigen